MLSDCDGSVIIKVSMDTAEAEKQVKSLSDRFKSGFSAAAKVAVKATAAGVAAASAGVAALAKASIESYAEYEQLVGGVETLFKESADIVKDYAANAYKTAGLSANEYMSTVTGFSASLLQGLGGDTKQAAEIANLAITDMADNANKMGTDMASIQVAYQGFAKQNYTMLDNLKLGYGGTQEEMIRLINDSGILNETISDLDGISFDQIIKAIHAVQNNLGITGTTAQEASSTIQGSISSMKSAWTNLVTGIADENADLDVLIGNFTDSVATAGENLIPRVEQILNGIGDAVVKLAPVISEAVPDLVSNVLPSLLDAGVQLIDGLLQGMITSLPALADSAVSIVDTLAETIVEQLPALLDAAIDVVVTLATGIADSLPELIPTIVDVVIQIVETLIDNVDKLVDAAIEIIIALADGLINAVPRLIEKIPVIIDKLLNAILDNAPKLLQAGIELIVMLVKGIVQSIPQIIATVPQIIKSIVSAYSDYLSDIFDIGKNIVNGVWEGIKSMATWLKDKVSGFFSGIVDGIKGLLGIHSPSKVFSGIGEYMMEGLARGIAGGASLAVRSAKSAAIAVENAAAPTLGFTQFPDVRIPTLAAGAVIPPNRRFLAVLGDQKSGTNVEAPLSTIEQAVENVLSRRGYSGGGEQTVILQVNRRELGRVVYKLNNEESRRVGVSLIEGV